jgi:hypothetical protein
MAALVCAALASSPAAAVAGSIGFKTDSEVTAGPGVDVKVTLTNTGDEAASDVSVRAEMLDKVAETGVVATIEPGKSQVWNIHLFDQVPQGVYAIVLRTRYADANGYPFEVASLATTNVGVKPAPRIFGNIDVPNLTSSGDAIAKITVKKPPGRSGSFEMRLAAPSGLEVKPDKVAIEFDESNKAVLEFQVRNRKLLVGTTVNVFAVVSGNDTGFPQMDTIRGNVRIQAAVTKVTAALFYQAAAAMAALLLLCEGIAWGRGRAQ